MRKFVDEAVRDNPMAEFPCAKGNLYGEYVAIMRKGPSSREAANLSL